MLESSTKSLFLIAQLLMVILLLSVEMLGQAGGSNTLYGELKVDESKVGGLKPMSFELVLTGRNLSAIGRQTVAKNGRYRFENLANGTYYISVRMDNTEIANVQVTLLGSSGAGSRVGSDYRQDIALEWRPTATEKREEKAAVVSAVKHYERIPPNDSLFDKAEQAIKEKNYTRAISLLKQIVSKDPNDFESWTELGTTYFLQMDHSEAEKSYLRALDREPTFILALLDLGKVRLALKNNEGAIEVLSRAVAVRPPSAEANYFLGEAYLNIGKGSKAVAYMNEAVRIDPNGKPEIYLRIGDIYEGVGLRELASLEYEKFLAKRADYPEKKKLQRYIAQNKKQSPVQSH